MLSEENISAEFPFESKFVDVLGSKIHYIEEGSGDPIVFMHGNSTSSYLWRNIIPHVSGLGRCIAFDLIGMGKSGKPDIEYGFFDHYDYFAGFLEALDLKNITFVFHDWGSALGFHYAVRHRDNVKAIAFMEAHILPFPDMDAFPEHFREMFIGFRTPGVGWDMIVNQNMFIEKTLPHGINRSLTEEEMNIYREPFLDVNTRKPLWRWPQEIPISKEPRDVYDAMMAYNEMLQKWDIPKLCLWVNPGALGSEMNTKWAKENLSNLRIVHIGEGHHFLQEDYPHRIGKEVANWYRAI